MYIAYHLAYAVSASVVFQNFILLKVPCYIYNILFVSD